MSVDLLPTDEGLEDKTVVLMLTCKKYEQLWVPFFTLFKRYWPDCPYKVIMGTDEGSYPDIETIATGITNWPHNCAEVLKQIDCERVILFLDDYLFYDKFKTDQIRKFVRHSYDFGVGCLRLAPCPGPTGPWRETSSLGVLNKNDPYRLSLQTAIWDKNLLLKLLVPGETAWQLEINGTKRASACSEPFLSVWRDSDEYPGGPTPYIITAVVKGEWIEPALELLKKENIPMDKITKVIK